MKPADLKPGQAMMVDWTADEYFASDLLSRSELWLLEEKGPPLYHAIVVEKSMPWPSSDSMDLGTLIHLAVLEPERFLAEVKIKPMRPKGKRPSRTKAAQVSDSTLFGLAPPGQWEVYDQQCQVFDRFEAAGGQVVTRAVAEKITTIATRVRSNGFAADLLSLPGSNEQAVIWREPTTGLLCRVRLDGIRHLPSGEVVVLDLKSSRTPEPGAFGRSIANLGYDFQGGFYSDAAQAMYPGRRVTYAIIAAGTERPYTVAAGTLAMRAIDEGRRKYKAAMADLVRRRETGNWRAPWEEDRGLVFDMPAWAYKRDKR